MSEPPLSSFQPIRPEEVDAEALVRELRDQIAAVKAKVEVHRETMRAAGLTGPAAPEEPRSWEGERETRADQ